MFSCCVHRPFTVESPLPPPSTTPQIRRCPQRIATAPPLAAPSQWGIHIHIGAEGGGFLKESLGLFPTWPLLTQSSYVTTTRGSAVCPEKERWSGGEVSEQIPFDSAAPRHEPHLPASTPPFCTRAVLTSCPGVHTQIHINTCARAVLPHTHEKEFRESVN
jgi:hypothetical protein